jgi:hypothetical protein
MPSPAILRERNALCYDFQPMEINQLKRFIKDLEERTGSLRGYL